MNLSFHTFFFFFLFGLVPVFCYDILSVWWAGHPGAGLDSSQTKCFFPPLASFRFHLPAAKITELQIGRDRMEGVSRKQGIWSCQSWVNNHKLMIASAGLTHAARTGLPDGHNHFNWKGHEDVGVKCVPPLSLQPGRTIDTPIQLFPFLPCHCAGNNSRLLCRREGAWVRNSLRD